MIPNLKMNVSYSNGGLSTVEVKPRSQIAFERKFDMGIAAAFGTGSDGLRFEHLYFLAWHASKSSAEFDAWIDTVEGIDMEIEAVDPTPPVPSDGP